MLINKKFLMAMTAVAGIAVNSGIVEAQGGADLDRNKQPTFGPAKALKFPRIVERKLDNGIQIAVMEDRSFPVVSVQLITTISSFRDPAAKTGLSSLVVSTLSEGTKTYTADQLADEFAKLGNSVSPFGFYTIPANVDRSIDLMVDQFLNPAFPADAIERLKATRIAGIKQAKDNPNYLAGRVLSRHLYGESHPYSRTSSEESIQSITRDDIVAFYNEYYRPPNIKLVVAGAISPDEAVAKLNKHFGSLTAGTDGKFVPENPKTPDSTVIYILDRPNSPQSVMILGTIGPRRDEPDNFATGFLNTVLGGAFNSRINLNLREQRQYSYGAGSNFAFRNVPELSTFTVSSSVVGNKTDSAVIEVMKELRGIIGDKPVTVEEFTFVKNQAINILPLQFATVGQKATAVASLYTRNLPLDYYDKLVGNFEKVQLDDVNAAAKKWIKPGNMVIVLVGDKAVIESGLRGAGIGAVVIADPVK